MNHQKNNNKDSINDRSEYCDRQRREGYRIAETEFHCRFDSQTMPKLAKVRSSEEVACLSIIHDHWRHFFLRPPMYYLLQSEIAYREEFRQRNLDQ